MINTLPQYEDDGVESRRRKNCLLKMQAKYEYAYDYAETIAIVRKLPWREIPGLRYWILGGLNLLQLIPSLPGLLLEFVRYLRGDQFTNYRDYMFFRRSPQPNPSIVDDFLQDSVFGLQRVIGVNPVALHSLSPQQPLPQNMSASAIREIFAAQVSDIDYEDAVKGKRLYVLDYAQLEVLRQNPGHIDGGRKQHITTPIVVLFQQSNGALRPLAIQLHQNNDVENRIYTVNDGNLWLAAKTYAQIADGNHHILVTHATRIHYVMEAIIMASRRQLFKTHPLQVLLHPHMQFTLNVNHQHTFLKNRKGQPGRFGEIFAGDYDATTQCMADAMTSFNFADTALPKDISRREVDNPDLFYPYRDDGMLLWEAIQEFARGYIELYYVSDDAVVQDHEIQAWATDISAGNRGRIAGFPQRFESRRQLGETLGHIIFLCTAHHSCIHFNQYAYPGFVPNMPYASYVPPLSGEETDISAAQLLKIQPAFRAAYTQTWTYYLTNFRVNRIGQYNLRRFDPEAHLVIAQFKKRLHKIEGQIERANDHRIVRYDRMRPSTIPNCVSV